MAATKAKGSNTATWISLGALAVAASGGVLGWVSHAQSAEKDRQAAIAKAAADKQAAEKANQEAERREQLSKTRSLDLGSVWASLVMIDTHRRNATYLPTVPAESPAYETDFASTRMKPILDGLQLTIDPARSVQTLDGYAVANSPEGRYRWPD